MNDIYYLAITIAIVGLALFIELGTIFIELGTIERILKDIREQLKKESP